MKDYIDYMDSIEADPALEERIAKGEARKTQRLVSYARFIPKVAVGFAAVLLIGAILAIPGLLSNLRYGGNPSGMPEYEAHEPTLPLYEQGEELDDIAGYELHEPEATIEGELQEHDLPPRVQRQEFLALREHYGNDDIIGHVQIPGTTIDYVVAQGEDNIFYLYHDLRGQRFSPGTIFMDYLADIHTPGDQNWVLFGHNMRANHKFHMVRNFMDYDFFHANRYIYFSTIYADYVFEVFSVYVTNIDFPYIWNVYDDWEYWINTFASMSMFDAGISVSADDRVLTLSTCEGSYRHNRIVVHGVLISETFPHLEVEQEVQDESIFERLIIIFDPNRGVFPDTETRDGVRFKSEGNVLTDFPPDPVRDGYVFGGWQFYDGSMLEHDYLLVESAISLSALWIAHEDAHENTFDWSVDWSLNLLPSILHIPAEIPRIDGDFEFHFPSIAPGDVWLVGIIDYAPGAIYQASIYAAGGTGVFMGVTRGEGFNGTGVGTLWRPLITGSGSSMQVTHYGNGYHYLFVGSTAIPGQLPDTDLIDVVVSLRLLD
ncbi:MAG: sortase [Defluviitaleaceae bacterium]|nr:sortase [Defluviitaleaceae bacterium]